MKSLQDIRLDDRPSSSVEESSETVGTRRLVNRHVLDSLPHLLFSKTSIQRGGEDGGKAKLHEVQMALLCSRRANDIGEVMEHFSSHLFILQEKVVIRLEFVDNIFPSPMASL